MSIYSWTNLCVQKKVLKTPLNAHMWTSFTNSETPYNCEWYGKLKFRPLTTENMRQLAILTI